MIPHCFDFLSFIMFQVTLEGQAFVLLQASILREERLQ